MSEIIETLNAREGIEMLNAMQLDMASSKSHNIVLLAPTGSGKTIAFLLYALQRLGKNNGRVQVVIIAPSRELVVQIAGVARTLATGYKVAALYGGHSMTDEVNTLSVTPAIIVATPGRLLDHLQRKQVEIDDVHTLVLDEYDKSLELGFEGEMSRIVRRMTAVKNVVLTSATQLTAMPSFMHFKDVETIDFNKQSETSSPRHRIQVVRVESPEKDKLNTLLELLISLDNGRVIVFVNHRESAERVYNTLAKAQFPVGLYHGGLEQRERQLAVDLLENGTTPVLVATDLAARGLDIDNVSAIVHYHLPVDAQAWVHRNGRTARQDASGTVFVITSEWENQPDYITYDRDYMPTGHNDYPIKSTVTTLYINAGKKEKISCGDIVGYLINKGGLTADEIGAIKLYDHSAIVAVPRDKAREVVKAVAPYKLKNTRVRVTRING